MVATGINADGYREILGIHTATSESHAGWLSFFRDLTARGLTSRRPGRAGHLRRPHRPSRGHRRRPCRALPGSGAAPTTRPT